MPPPAEPPPTHRPPTRTGTENGIAYMLWLPEDPSPWPAVLILHGAGSRKESHTDFARLACANGWAAMTFDARGHGESEGDMGPAAVDDVVGMSRSLAREPGVDADRVVLRGSSMGGFFALHATAIEPRIAGVIAICPASEETLSLGFKQERFDMRVGDRDGIRAWLAEHDLRDAVEMIGPRPLVFLHAEGDEDVPVAFTRELHERAIGPRKLIVEPGGHHRSVQHDAELQSVALRWMERQLPRD